MKKLNFESLSFEKGWATAYKRIRTRKPWFLGTQLVCISGTNILKVNQIYTVVVRPRKGMVGVSANPPVVSYFYTSRFTTLRSLTVDTLLEVLNA